jgi:AcrR family transcriptional regulator
VGHKYTKGQILDGALAAAFDDGLSQLTFGRLAKRLGISDRVIVYYFPSKDDLISEILVAMGLQLQATLAEAFTTPAPDHLELMRTAWPVVAAPEADRVFALFFEANGLATAGREPYRTVVPKLVAAWIEWAGTFVIGTPRHRLVEAQTAIAMIDGLLLLKQLQGSEAADQVAERLGIR